MYQRDKEITMKIPNMTLSKEWSFQPYSRLEAYSDIYVPVSKLIFGYYLVM